MKCPNCGGYHTYNVQGAKLQESTVTGATVALVLLPLLLWPFILYQFAKDRGEALDTSPYLYACRSCGYRWENRPIDRELIEERRSSDAAWRKVMIERRSARTI